MSTQAEHHLNPPPLRLVIEERELEGSEGMKDVLEKCMNVAGVLRSHCVLRKQPTQMPAKTDRQGPADPSKV